MTMQVSTQDYSSKIIRDSAILTSSYVAGTVLTGPVGTGMQLMNQLLIYINFTKGSLDSASIKVEFSNDHIPGGADGTWFQETFASVSAGVETDTLGVHTISATGKYRLLLNIKDRFIKISAIGTGTATSSLMDILAPFGVI